MKKIFNIKNKKVLLCGSSGILGSYYSKILNQEGADLCLLDIKTTKFINLAKKLKTKHLFIDCENENELVWLFSKLSENGKIMMPLDNYGFSQKFGFVEDQFGVSWQLNLK